jgi:hypothetical protein
MKAGDRVLCVEGSESEVGPVCETGKEYTIEWIGYSPRTGHLGIRLVGEDWTDDEGDTGCSWYAERFEKVLKSNSIEL